MNLSKLGVGLSVGVPGARISTGPRGTYIHLGSHGVYYRQRVDGFISTPQFEPHQSPDRPLEASYEDTENIDVDQLISLSSHKLISQINEKIQQRTYATIIGIITTILAPLILVPALTFWPINFIINDRDYGSLIHYSFIGVSGTILVIGFYVAWVTHKQETLARMTTLKYKLDTINTEKFSRVQSAITNFASCSRLWQVTARQSNWDWKRNAGASALIQRRLISCGPIVAPFLSINMDVYGLSVGDVRLFFLPDQILVLQNNKYGSINYEQLQIHASPTRFIEDEGVPTDSRVVGHTWKYIRKDGGPDLRFANNRQIPVALYGLIQFFTPTGLRIDIQASNLEKAQQFAASLEVFSHQRARTTGPDASAGDSQYSRFNDTSDNSSFR